MTLKRMRYLLERARSSGRVEGDSVETLRVLLEALLVLDDHTGRLQWLEAFGAWLRGEEPVPSRFRIPGEEGRSQRLRMFLTALRDYPAARDGFLRNLRFALLEVSGLKLFADTGLPSEYGFASEATERILRRVLPHPPDEGNLSELLERMFTSNSDAHWIANLGRDLLVEMARGLFFEGDVERNPWRQIKHDMLDAVTVLAADVASLGVSKDLLDRLPRGSLRDLPFLVLTHEVDDLVTSVRDEDAFPDALRQEHASRVRSALSGCRAQVTKVISHLETHGVSVHLVYRLEKISAILDRLEALVGILVPQEGLLTVRQISVFVGTLVRGIHEDRSVRSLVRANTRQLSRKVVERSGENGEHYIARSRAGWKSLLRGAAGGGFLTVFTSLGKLVASGAGFPLFVEGFALSVNYAASFLVMQFAGFKLATKQPANFAAALAGKLLEKRYLDDSREFVREVAHVTRSQTATVVGNIGVVVPAAIAFNVVWTSVRGAPVLDAERAAYAVGSLDPIRSGTIFYALLTGVILMAGSLVGSWLENFVVFRRLPEALARNRDIVRLLGAERAQRVSRAFLHGISGTGASIALGFMLGMTPVVGTFFGVPLDVRHVTLSTAQLTLGLSSLGFDALLSPQGALAVLGIVCVAALNFGVSFALGLLIAIRAREVSVPAAAVLLRDTLRTFVRHPLDFFVPRSQSALDAEEAQGSEDRGRPRGHGGWNDGGDPHGKEGAPGTRGGSGGSDLGARPAGAKKSPDGVRHGGSPLGTRPLVGATAHPLRAFPSPEKGRESEPKDHVPASRRGALRAVEVVDEPGFDSEPSPL